MKSPKIKSDKKPLLNTFEAAGRELGVHPSLLKRAADIGQLAVVELGRRRLIPRAELVRISGGAISE
jgi:hypothetical protein